MSEANRKKEYDRLVSLGRYKDIDQGLINEFGEPKKPDQPKIEIKQKLKVRK